MNKNFLIFDFTQREFSNEEEFKKLIEDYPTDCLLLVTKNQKSEIVGFSGNSTRYTLIEGTSQDVLTYDGLQVTVRIVTARDIDNLYK